MSFGFGVGDILAVANLARGIYETCKVGPREYKELCNEIRSLSHALESLADEGKNIDSVLDLKRLQRKTELDAMIKSCKSTMTDLQAVIDRHSSLQSDHTGNITRLWDSYQVGSSDLDSYRGKLTLHTSIISVFLMSLQGPAIGRIESKLDKVYARILRDDLAQPGQSSASLASTVSILSQIDTNEDDVFAILKSELLAEGIPMARIFAHKDDILSYMRKLVQDGTSGNFGGEEHLNALNQRTQRSLLSSNRMAPCPDQIGFYEQQFHLKSKERWERSQARRKQLQRTRASLRQLRETIRLLEVLASFEFADLRQKLTVSRYRTKD